MGTFLVELFASDQVPRVAKYLMTNSTFEKANRLC